MKQKKALYILGIATLATIIIGLAWAEQITLTSYYPAPYGVYRQMETSVSRLVPSNGPPGFISGEEEEGMLYFDDGTARTKGCYYWDADAGDWVPLGGGGGGGDGAGHGKKALQQQVQQIDTTVSGFEQDMFNQLSFSSFPPFQKALVLFTAPFAKTASGGWARIRIFINGVPKRTLYISPDSTIGSQVAPIAFHHLEKSPMSSINVQVKWQGSGIIQPGNSLAPRILTVLATD